MSANHLGAFTESMFHLKEAQQCPVQTDFESFTALRHFNAKERRLSYKRKLCS